LLITEIGPRALRLEIGLYGPIRVDESEAVRVKRHDAESRSAPLILEQAERKEPADERPVRIDSAAVGAEKDAASIAFVSKNGVAFFRMQSKEVGRAYPETPGQAQGLVGSDPDGLVGTADAANLALERKRAVHIQVEAERCGKSGRVHWLFLGVKSYFRPGALSIGGRPVRVGADFC